MSTTSSKSPRWWSHLKRGRHSQRISEIKFIDHWPLVLKNQVSTRRGKESEVPCLKETLAFITCLKDKNNAHELCLKEGESVRTCYSTYLGHRYENKGKKKVVEDFQPEKNVKDLPAEELNRFLSHFPHKLKKN